MELSPASARMPAQITATQIFVAALLAMSPAGLTGCAEAPEQAAVMEALNTTVEALTASDWRRLWDITAPSAQEDLLQLHRDAHAARKDIDQRFPSDARGAAIVAIGGPLLTEIPIEEGETGPRLLQRLLEPEAMRLDAQAMDGLFASRPVIHGEQATVNTPVGETFTFVRTDAGWRSRLVMDILDQNDRAIRLRENIEAVRAAGARHALAWQRERNPATPHGAFNAARDALAERPVNGVLLHALLDKASRQVLVTALKQARDVQREIQAGVRGKQQRAEAHTRRGISLHAKADTDVALLNAWLNAENHAETLLPTVHPERVKTHSETQATVISSEGDSVEMVLEASQWRIASLQETLRDALLLPLQTPEP